MLLEKLRELCHTLPRAEEYTMVHHPAFRAGKKPFLILGLGGQRPNRISLNLGLMEQAERLQVERFTRTPYIGQHGWFTVLEGDIEWPELEEMVVASYRRVATKAMLKELG